MARVYKRGKDIVTYTHGKYGTRVYSIWNGIKQRCKNPRFGMYKSYGAIGITVCKKWEDFVGFYEDVGDPPTKNHSIDRIDNNKGYSKENCRWATPKQQARNRKSSRFITVGTETKTLAEWSEISRIHPETISGRIERGWLVEEAISIKPVHGRNQSSGHRY